MPKKWPTSWITVCLTSSAICPSLSQMASIGRWKMKDTVGLYTGVEHAAFRQWNAVVEAQQFQGMVQPHRSQLILRRVVLDDAHNIAIVEYFGELEWKVFQDLIHEGLEQFALYDSSPERLAITRAL